jgi:hypothetical protein
VDSNADGVTGQGELKTLGDLNISQLSLTTSTTDARMDNGNLVSMNSSYQTTDGATHAAADVWFQVDLRSNVSNLTQAMAEFGTTEATEANAVSLTEGMVKQSHTAPVLAVANLVDAMKQFDQSAPASAVSGSFMQDTANLAKAQIAQSAATDMLAKARPDGLAPQGILGMPK